MLRVEIITALGAIRFAGLIKAAPIIIMQRAVSWVAVAGVAGTTIFTLTLYDLYKFKTTMCGQSVLATITGDGEDNKLKCAGGAALFAAASAAYVSVAFIGQQQGCQWRVTRR